MFDRRLVQYFDWPLLIMTVLLCGLGLVTLYSAVTAGIPTPQQSLVYRQLFWFGIGLAAMTSAFLFDYKSLDQWANVIYVLCVVLLVCVLIFGKQAGGSKRWLILGPITLQPSETMKIGLIIVLSKYYSKVAHNQGLIFRELLIPFILTIIPCALIIQQPDLGTAIVLVLIVASMTFYVKIERRTFISIIVAFTVLVPLAWIYLLKEYQKQRVLTFLNPDRDPLGAGYHIIQSKIAIGSGMLSGKGFLKGTQNALSFLPERHTDFIFSVLAEEWGFAGSLVVLILLAGFILWALHIAHRCREPFGIILSVGVTAMIFWQIVINICMVMGLMPVVGVPLPFISYGGSSAVTVMICIGLLMNVSMRRFMFE
ncbi:MAG: rod shape-determining protein RodA [Desulfobacterales bacterium]|nr:rod shape-determining protein RodA [Desulfobacterales bacterium]